MGNIRNILSILVFSLVIFAYPSYAQEGQLKILGNGVEELILRTSDGQTKDFVKPQQSITLPVGRYTVSTIILEGGYNSSTFNENINISEDKPAELKVGAPLKQIIEAKRQGNFIELNYQLTGIGGESYRDMLRTEKAGFAVYKGDKLIASEDFEYG